MTVLPYASLPVPKAKVFGPWQWTENVDVVLLGLKTEGISYLSGDGDLVLPEKSQITILKTYRWIFP